MRNDSLAFKTLNEAPGKSPRFVVIIVFDVASIAVTSHSDITSVPGIVLADCLKSPSAISQRIVPDEGRSEIGTFSFDIVDLNSDFTDEVRAKLAAGKGLRNKTVQLWCGFKGQDFSLFQLFQTQIVSGCEYDAGVYRVTCEDITRFQREDIFDVKSTTLAVTMSATDTSMTVASTQALVSVRHSAAWADAPSSTVGYIKVDKEIIRWTGKTTTTLTGLTRGCFNTVAAAHTVDPASPQERRPRVEEFTYLDMPAPKMALAILTGVMVPESSTPWPCSVVGTQGGFETDSNADGVGDGWAVFIGGTGIDAGRVQTPSRPAGSSPFVGVCQRLLLTTVTNSNDSGITTTNPCRSGLTFTYSGYVRTNVSSKVRLLMRFYDANNAILADNFSAYVVGDSIAHFAQVTAVSPPFTELVTLQVRGINANGEFLEADQIVCEVGSTPHAYNGSLVQGFLPEHWHLGIEPEFLQPADFTGIGSDLWTTTDDALGFNTRFEGLTKQDGKRFLEKELYLLLGAFSPVYSDGSLGLRRLPAMISDAAPIAVLTEREVVSVSPLEHDYASLHNQIRVTWGFDIGLNDFTRDTLFQDGDSVSIHGKAPIIAYQFRGLHSGVHTENMIVTRLNAIRDAYTYPPQRTTVTVLPSLNRFENGDVMALAIANVRDFAGVSANINRSFVILRRSINFRTGEVAFELFGSTLRPGAQAPSTEGTTPLADAFYNSAGVALNTVIGMTGNNVNVGSHNITGNASMLASGAVFYHLGDLNIPNGANITISNNVQLRVRGFITLNGTIVGTGGGKAGTADPGPPPNGGIMIDGLPGFIGNSRGWDGIDATGFVHGITIYQTIPVRTVKGQYAAWPPLNLEVGAGGTSLVGIPGDLRGGGGAPGGRTVLSYSSNQTAAGGTGGAGGAGLAIICRGMSFGVSSAITLNGANTSNPAVEFSPFVGMYPGAGGAGAPGAGLILLDGNAILIPNALGRFQAKTGTITQAGVPLPSQGLGWSPGVSGIVHNPDKLPFSGYADSEIISNLDMSIAALRIAYIPVTQTPAPNQDQLPAPVTALTVTGGVGFNVLRATLPAADTFDFVEYYAAITNNRAGAVLIARGRMSEFQHDLPALTSRYYWVRTTRTNSRGLELYSDWFPVSSTGGVLGTTLADPDAVFLETFDNPWEVLWTNQGSSGSVVITYPSNGQFGGKVISAQRQLWIEAAENIPYDDGALYRITARIRRTVSGGGSNEAVYVGVAGVAADGTTMIDESGGSSHGSQHYNCARGFDMSTIAVNTWKDFVGWFRGLSTSGFGVAPNNDSPTPLRTGVKYFRPLVILNYASGTGTMECDFVKVERLVTPDDADNTNKIRLVPDAEFSRSTGNEYWWFALFGSGVNPTISLTGGLIDGRASMSPRSGGTSSAVLVSRPRPAQLAVVGEIYTITVRWRRTGTYSSGAPFLFGRIIRHDQNGTSSTFANTYGTDYQLGAGGLFISCDTSYTVNTWYEASAIVSVPAVDTGLTSNPLNYISAWLELSGGTTGDAAIEVDYVMLTKGTASEPQRYVNTASGGKSVSREDIFSELVYNGTGAATYNFPDATLWPNAMVVVRQQNTGVLTLAYPSGTAESSPGLTGSRNLAGRYATALAQWTGTTWQWLGQLA